MKQMSLFVILLISSLFCLSLQDQLLESKIREKLMNSVYWEGWIKYFNFKNGAEMSKPDSFFVNDEFFHQKALIEKRADKDKYGYKYIPSKFHFYAKLLDNTFNVLSTRDRELKRTVNVLNLQLIKPLDYELKNTNKDGFTLENYSNKGSIKDLGNFNEGKCISVSTIIPESPDENFIVKEDTKGPSEIWIICLDDGKEKEKLLGDFIGLKLKLQKRKEKKEIIQAGNSSNSNSLSDALKSKQTSKIERYTGAGASLKDGYLILLSDWSQCTVKCGGGLRYQQWMCVPAKEGGRPCMKDLIRTIPCNPQPCPGVTEFKTAEKKTEQIIEHITLEPIYKSAPISSRPQQFVECVIKENDILLTQNMAEFTPPKIINTPGRIIMNNRTISLFTDENYEDAVFNFDLSKTDFFPIENELCCFKLKSENKSFRLCSFTSDCGNAQNPKFINDWKYSFYLFKNKCYSKFDYEHVEHSLAPLPDAPGDEMMSDSESLNIAEEVVNEREKLLRKKLDDLVEKKLEKKVEESQKLALKAIKRELNIEEMIKKEEIMKAKQESLELVEVMKHEQAKREKLEQAFRERENEEVRMRQIKEVKKQIMNIQIEANKEVQSKRENLKTKIMEIRNKAERRKRLINQQISMIRGQIAKDLITANKEGNISTCKDAKDSQDKLNQYCNDHVVDDYNKNIECRNKDNFCYICCENEFGNLFLMKKRRVLYNV